MPLPRKIDPIEDERGSTSLFAELCFNLGLMTRPQSQADDTPRVGRYKADYSELTVEQIAAEAGCEELFKHSKPKPISR